jgi:DNA-binding NtrC family response regulator
VSELRVLLVDDEEELVTALVERLGYRGIEAQYALDGHRAIEMIRAESYDVVVLDFKLPGMSGVEVHRVIKTERPDLPVVLITGHGAPPDQIPDKPGEHYDILEKPVGLAVLLDKIKEVTGKK